MKNKSLVIVGLLIVVSLFYWFELRPANIRKDCAREALESSVQRYTYYQHENTIHVPNTAKRAELQEKAEAVMYQNCINGAGLK